jgi:ribose-phosphate pyrophosphokinase
MVMIVTSCGNSVTLAHKVATSLKIKFSPLTISSFPDGDIYLKFNTRLKGKTLIIINSFQPDSDTALFRCVVAAQTAKQLGAKKVILVAPYLAYMRQDTMFNYGESITSRIMANLLNQSIDVLITIDSHLHRYTSLKEIFKVPAKNLTANEVIGEYVQKKIKNPVIIGPDAESYQWAEVVASIAGCESSVFQKTRHSSRHVTEKMIKKIDMVGKNVVIVDDIISTGHTICEAAKKAMRSGAKSVTAIGVHGLLVEGAVAKMRKAGVSKVITTNCIEHETNKIDVASVLVDELKKLKR